jgi:hypothetical protein
LRASAPPSTIAACAFASRSVEQRLMPPWKAMVHIAAWDFNWQGFYFYTFD